MLFHAMMFTALRFFRTVLLALVHRWGPAS